MGACVASHIPH